MVVRRSSVPRRSSRPSANPGGGSSPSLNDARVTVPKLNNDPIWSLRPWPVVVNLAGQDYDIPALPAADWLAYLMQDPPDLDSFIGDWIPDIDDLLFDEVISFDELSDIILDLLTTITARPWYVALRLIGVARNSYDVLGPEMIRRRVDPERHSLSAWLDVLLVAILNSMEPKDTTMFLMKLEAKPESVESVPLDEMEMDRGAFLAMGFQ